MKKRALTLLEIMIVIFLITLITGTIGYSMRGTLEKGRAFRTEQAKDQLRDLLLICLADGVTPEAILKNPAECLKTLGLAKDPDHLVLDGWKEPFQIKFNPKKTDLTIESEALENYNNKTKRQKRKAADVEEE